MENTFVNIGIFAVLSLIVYIYKKILEWHTYNRSSIYEDENVYRAADEFARGSSLDAVKSVLSDCLDFTKEYAEEVLKLSIPHRPDRDGGYKAFLRAVNKVLGEEAYDVKHHT